MFKIASLFFESNFTVKYTTSYVLLVWDFLLIADGSLSINLNTEEGLRSQQFPSNISPGVVFMCGL